jgi:hypothetical protein
MSDEFAGRFVPPPTDAGVEPSADEGQLNEGNAEDPALAAFFSGQIGIAYSSLSPRCGPRSTTRPCPGGEQT